MAWVEHRWAPAATGDDPEACVRLLCLEAPPGAMGHSGPSVGRSVRIVRLSTRRILRGALVDAREPRRPLDVLDGLRRFVLLRGEDVAPEQHLQRTDDSV